MRSKDVLEHFIIMDENRMELKGKYNNLVYDRNRLLGENADLRRDKEIYKKANKADENAIVDLFNDAFKNSDRSSDNLKTKKELFELINGLWNNHIKNCVELRELEAEERRKNVPVSGGVLTDVTGCIGGGTMSVQFSNQH